MNHQTVNQHISNMDIATFILDLTETEAKTFGDNPFKYERVFPVFADLGDKVYFPLENQIHNLDTLLKNQSSAIDESNKKDILYYRALMHLMNDWPID